MVAPTRVVDRAFSEAAIEWNINNIDGDVASTFDLPVGFGDCALLECSLEVNTVATMQAAFASSGPWFQLTAQGVAQDVGFTGRWNLREADRVGAWAAPDQVQLWKENEQLLVGFPEIDTNASPTADMSLVAKVKRLRVPRSAPGEGEFHLVQPGEFHIGPGFEGGPARRRTFFR